MVQIGQNGSERAMTVSTWGAACAGWARSGLYPEAFGQVPTQFMKNVVRLDNLVLVVDQEDENPNSSKKARPAEKAEGDMQGKVAPPPPPGPPPGVVEVAAIATWRTRGAAA